MKRYFFPYASGFITLEAQKEIHSNILGGVSRIIKNNESELNHNILNSSAYIFNEANVGAEVPLGPEFLSFLNTNIKYLRFLKEGFNPFRGVNFGLDDLDSIISISPKSAIKNISLMIDTSILRTPFVLDSIMQFLVKSKVTNIVLNYGNLYFAFGNPVDICIKVDEINEINLKLVNQATSLNYNQNSRNKKQHVEGFANMYKLLIHKFSVTKNFNLVENKVMSTFLAKLNTEDDYTIFSNEWKKILTLVDMEDNMHIFKPTV